MLNVYSLEETEKWDEVVHSFAQSDVYYLSGYVKAFALHGDGEPMLFYYENDSVRGINVVMKRDIASDERFFHNHHDLQGSAGGCGCNADHFFQYSENYADF